MIEPKIVITHDFLNLIAELDEFKGKWEAFKNTAPETLHQLRHIAAIESIGSSTRIEGAVLTDAEVETLLSNLAIQPFTTRDAQEVAGYAEAMELVLQNHDAIRLTENHIKQLHQILLKHSTKNTRHRGQYKKHPNHVAAFDSSGKQIGIVFETVSPFDTPLEMEELVKWTNKTLEEDAMHPLLVTAVFVVVFLAIHPFQDGNGRLSRILTTLLLLRAGYHYVPYSSLERVVEENKDFYYQALRRTQVSLKKPKQNWDPWLGFFLRGLKKQKDHLATKLHSENLMLQTDLPLLSVEILTLMNRHPRLTNPQIAELTGANSNTVKVRLRELVQAGHIKRFGKGRATWYTK